MGKSRELLKRLAGKRQTRPPRERRRRRDPDFFGSSYRKDIEQAPPGRAQELAGHAVERVET